MSWNYLWSVLHYHFSRLSAADLKWHRSKCNNLAGVLSNIIQQIIFRMRLTDAYLLRLRASDSQGIDKVIEPNTCHESYCLLKIPKLQNHKYWLQPWMTPYSLMMQQSLPTFANKHHKPDQIFRLSPKVYSLHLNLAICYLGYEQHLV